MTNEPLPKTEEKRQLTRLRLALYHFAAGDEERCWNTLFVWAVHEVGLAKRGRLGWEFV
jgi:hypothetical protein